MLELLTLIIGFFLGIYVGNRVARHKVNAAMQGAQQWLKDRQTKAKKED